MRNTPHLRLMSDACQTAVGHFNDSECFISHEVVINKSVVRASDWLKIHIFHNRKRGSYTVTDKHKYICIHTCCGYELGQKTDASQH